MHVEPTRVRMAQLERGRDRLVCRHRGAVRQGRRLRRSGLASRFIEGIDGSYSNVVGLPVSSVYRLLKQLGCDILGRLGKRSLRQPSRSILSAARASRSPYDNKFVKIAAHRCRAAVRLRRAALVLAAAGHRVLQARRRSDGEPRAVAGKALQLHGFVVQGTWGQNRTRSNIGSRSRTRAASCARPTRHRAGHVQGRIRSRAEGPAHTTDFEVEPNGVMAKCPSKYEEAPNYDLKPGTQ